MIWMRAIFRGAKAAYAALAAIASRRYPRTRPDLGMIALRVIQGHGSIIPWRAVLESNHRP
jgi:hypothetical protein